MLCLLQVVDNAPQGYRLADNMADLRGQLPDDHASRAIREILARIVDEPRTGKFRLGDGYWLLVAREPSWLDRILGT